MQDLKLKLFKEAAIEFGTTNAVISGLVKALGITPKAVPLNGNAKGLDRRDMALLRRVLKPGKRAASASSSL